MRACGQIFVMRNESIMWHCGFANSPTENRVSEMGKKRANFLFTFDLCLFGCAFRVRAVEKTKLFIPQMTTSS